MGNNRPKVRTQQFDGSCISQRCFLPVALTPALLLADTSPGRFAMENLWSSIRSMVCEYQSLLFILLPRSSSLCARFLPFQFVPFSRGSLAFSRELSSTNRLQGKLVSHTERGVVQLEPYRRGPPLVARIPTNTSLICARSSTEKCKAGKLG